MPRVREEGSDQIQQDALLGQRIVVVPQAVDALANQQRTLRIVALYRIEPPVLRPGNLLKNGWLKVANAVAPAGGGEGVEAICCTPR